jgi:hypothetical protein
MFKKLFLLLIVTQTVFANEVTIRPSISIFGQNWVIPDGCMISAKPSIIGNSINVYCFHPMVEQTMNVIVSPAINCTREKITSSTGGLTRDMEFEHQTEDINYYHVSSILNDRDDIVYTRIITNKDSCITFLSNSQTYLIKVTESLWLK